MSRQKAPIISWAVLVGALFVLWSTAFIYRSSFLVLGGERHFCLFDDAMISLRYAWNLAHGNGLVWNPGERTEGFTNMLMTLIMAVPSALLEKRFVVLSIQIFGALTMVAAGYFSMKIGLSLFPPGPAKRGKHFWGALFFSAPLLYYPLSYWTLMGMETGLFTLLLYAAISMVITENTSAGRPSALPIVLGLAFWTRPDAAIPVFLIMCFRGLALARSRRALRRFALETAGVAIMVLLLTLFRWFYYGQIFPNTYTLKMENIPLGLRFENGFSYLTQFLSQMWLPLMLAAGGLVFTRHKNAGLIAVLIVAAHGYQVYAGGDPWLYWRFLSPYVPLAFLLAVGSVPKAVSVFRSRFGEVRTARKEKTPSSRWIARTVVAVACCLFVGFANYPFRHEALLIDLPYNVEFNHATVSVAKAIEEVTTEQATVGVFWAGSIPFYTGRPAVDFLGKTDAYIASLPPDTSGKVSWRGMRSVPGHNKYDLKYSIVEKAPTYVQNGKWGGQNVFEFLKENYRGVYYKGVPLMLKKNSPFVDWELIEQNPPPSPHAVPLGRVHAIP